MCPTMNFLPGQLTFGFMGATILNLSSRALIDLNQIMMNANEIQKNFMVESPNLVPL